MRITITGATGVIGSALVAELTARGDEVTVLSRNPERARATLGDVEVAGWDPLTQPAPAAALRDRDAVVHLAGESVSQRWTAERKRAIRDSRVLGTRHLVEGLRAADPRPRVLITGSAIGYYGPHGEEPIDEEAPPGHDFVAQVCVEWEREGQAAAELGLRAAQMRTGVVLDADGGALAKMLPPFRLGLGGPVAGGRQYIPWIHRDDVSGMLVAAIEDERWSGPFNATAPEPATNRDFSHALGRALHRPAFAPVPGVAIRLLFGEMSEIITTGVRAVPAKPLVLGYTFRHRTLDEALAAALG
jgi:uncharacterized protein (TIGR01777 family)